MTEMVDRRMLVLYGSQTGTAQDVSERLARDAKRHHFHTRVMPLDTYNISEMIKEKIIVFVVATTGQGDPPDNMQMFWRFILRRNLPVNSLASVQFAVLALGDSSYQKFNFIGKKLQKRILQLGGQSLLDIGLADDQHDLGSDAVVDPWSESLMGILMSKYPLQPGQEIISKDIRPPSRYRLECVEASDTIDTRVPYTGSDPPSQIHPHHATLLSNARVTAPDHWQDVRLVKLDITGANIRYRPGDVAMIQPQNMPDTVQEFITLLKLHPHKTWRLCMNDPDLPLPSTLPSTFTLQYLVENYLDINSVPRRSFFELLSYFADNELEREKLLEFCSPEGQEELYTYCNRPRRTILEILGDFPQATANITLDYIFDLIPSLKPRAFSIASSQQAHGDVLHILMAVVRYKTKLYAPRRGVCSTWLASLNPHTSKVKIPMWVKKGTIQFPNSAETPVVMVGPGTGVAPFRSFISERTKNDTGGNKLFFGCRNERKDYFFQCEWAEHQKRGLMQVHPAFSRDQEEKVYVQDKMLEQDSDIWDLIHNKQAYFMLAGNAKRMPDDVRATLQRIIQQYGGLTEDQADQYIASMEKAKRYQAETWS